MNVKEIDNLYYYNKDDLGLTIKKEVYNFKIWSPLADSVYLCIYNDYENDNFIRYNMEKTENGVFEVKINYDIKNKYYNFVVSISGKEKELVDPYAKAVCVNGKRAAIIDMNDTNPIGFLGDSPIVFKNTSEAIICELGVRDISIDISSNLDFKGKFLALAQKQDYSFENKTGINHIKEMGFTHVQIMPFYDFASIDESLANNDEVENSRPYNWGYDPQNYNCVEGSYSTDQYDPYCRIRELKTTIKSIHDENLGVIMDVVYNHMYEYDKSGFHISMPGYFFRYKDGIINDETGCGNVIASENKMARKFIVDSVKFWAREYNLDGFRFDLMGLIDIDTMNEIKKELIKINSSIIIIGEGWNMDSILPEAKRSIQKNVAQMEGIGFFNDTMRDGLRGSGFTYGDKGFLSGAYFKCEDVKKSIVAGVDYSPEIKLWGDANPSQIINYVECHDNHTCYDKLKMDGVKDLRLKDAQKLGISVVMLSQGIPFMQIGQEFLRSKHGVENSYNSPDSTNKVNWNLKKQNIDSVIYTKGLIELRKSNSLFRLENKIDIKNGLKFMDTKDFCIAYIIEKNSKKMLVIHNASEENYSLNFEKEMKLEVLVNKYIAGTNVIETLKTRVLNVDGISTFVAKIIL